MTPQNAPVLDLSAFPIVRLRTAGLAPGYAPRWATEMDALLQRGQPFVLLADEPHGEESHDDRKAKMLWFKANKAAFAAICRGLVAVEPDAVKRAAMKIQGLALATAFGVKFDVVAEADRAQRVATALLG